MMNSDDESDEELDPISNWEKEDLEEDDIGDDEDLLNGFLPGDDDDDDDGF